MKSWPLTEEQISTFNSMVSKARREKDESEEKRKRMKFGDCDRDDGFFKRNGEFKRSLYLRHKMQRQGRSWETHRYEVDHQQVRNQFSRLYT